MTTKTAILLGATGLTGQQLLAQLLEHPAYHKVVALVRRPLSQQHPKLEAILFDFDHPDPRVVQGDDLFCALGTTRSKAGSLENQYHTDVTYPLELGSIARQNGVRRYLLVSSIGADAHSGNAYLAMKGNLEEGLKKLDFELFVSARPSFLLGERHELRLSERIGIGVAAVLSPVMVGPLRKYRGIAAAQVAKALIGAANSGLAGNQTLESDQLQAM